MINPDTNLSSNDSGTDIREYIKGVEQAIKGVEQAIAADEALELIALAINSLPEPPTLPPVRGRVVLDGDPGEYPDPAMLEHASQIGLRARWLRVPSDWLPDEEMTLDELPDEAQEVWEARESMSRGKASILARAHVARVAREASDALFALAEALRCAKDY